MIIRDFLEDFKDFISRQPCVHGYTRVHIIANPAAGSFTRRRVFSGIKEGFRRYTQKAAGASAASASGEIPLESIFIHITEGPGDCTAIVRGIIADYGEDSRILFIIVGGDGTAAEAASEIYRFIEQGGTGDNLVLFRLPMGTGNDGLDADTMDTAFQICASRCNVKKIPLLEVKFATKERKFATNIASFGLDAYVTDKTNKLKKVVPGSFYSVMVDVAALFYDHSVDMDPMTIEYTDPNGEVRTDSFTALLLAVGVSGNRTYGGGKWVLPGRENVCKVGRMKILRKFTVKELLYKGEHTSLDEVAMYEAREIRVGFSRPLLFQHDGEVLHLTKDDFPVTLTVLPPVLSVLRPLDTTILRDLRGIQE